MMLSYLVKKYKTSTTSTQRPTLPQEITNHALNWLTRAIAIACNFAKIYKKSTINIHIPVIITRHIKL